MRSRFNINKYSNLVQRAITAFVGGILVLAASIYSDWTYFLIFAGILGFSQMEFYKLSAWMVCFPEDIWYRSWTFDLCFDLHGRKGAFTQ